MEMKNIGSRSFAKVLDMIDTLSSQDKRPLIVLDAGLATEINLKWLKDQDYGCIVVSRRKKT
ncbi:MAG TPA: hypothetical protein DDW17_03770 [Deltaproteobacteria bacterium]|nr:hypothetical protein [Deltaproteobacteria bacterium]